MMACSSVTDVKFKLKLPQCQKEFASSAALELREYQDWGGPYLYPKRIMPDKNSLPLLDPLVCIRALPLPGREEGEKN